jgi:hypothetical protein
MVFHKSDRLLGKEDFSRKVHQDLKGDRPAEQSFDPCSQSAERSLRRAEMGLRALANGSEYG